MLCVCLSFPITELCLLKRRSDAFLISAFLTDEEQALTGGTVCFKNRLTSHSVFTSDTIHCSRRSCSAAFSHYNFLDLYSFSCTVIKCIVPCAQVCYGAMQRKNEITYHVFFLKCSKLKNTPQGTESLRGGCTLILSSAGAYNTYSMCFQHTPRNISFKLITITIMINYHTFLKLLR